MSPQSRSPCKYIADSLLSYLQNRRILSAKAAGFASCSVVHLTFLSAIKARAIVLQLPNIWFPSHTSFKIYSLCRMLNEYSSVLVSFPESKSSLCLLETSKGNLSWQCLSWPMTIPFSSTFSYTKMAPSTRPNHNCFLHPSALQPYRQTSSTGLDCGFLAVEGLLVSSLRNSGIALLIIPLAPVIVLNSPSLNFLTWPNNGVSDTFWHKVLLRTKFLT
mmetsp:Transcript_10351/g.20741  ORF Transcript_10351/g.20741 Transcript_10351/m.20741 type:complete len:218 (-) Transcript_10351:199-852(-)